MMFIEFHNYHNGEKILFNIANINIIYPKKGHTKIFIGGVVYEIRETYSEVIDAINNYYNLSKA